MKIYMNRVRTGRKANKSDVLNFNLFEFFVSNQTYIKLIRICYNKIILIE